MPNDPGFRYPPPSHALTVWFTGNALALAIPPSGPDSRGHTVMIPLEKCQLERTEGGSIAARALGWATLLSLLQARASADAADNPRPRIGELPSPSLWQIEQALKAGRKSGSGGKPRAIRATTLSDLGLE